MSKEIETMFPFLPVIYALEVLQAVVVGWRGYKFGPSFEFYWTCIRIDHDLTSPRVRNEALTTGEREARCT